MGMRSDWKPIGGGLALGWHLTGLVQYWYGPGMLMAWYKGGNFAASIQHWRGEVLLSVLVQGCFLRLGWPWIGIGLYWYGTGMLLVWYEGGAAMVLVQYWYGVCLHSFGINNLEVVYVYGIGWQRDVIRIVLVGYWLCFGTVQTRYKSGIGIKLGGIEMAFAWNSGGMLLARYRYWIGMVLARHRYGVALIRHS